MLFLQFYNHIMQHRHFVIFQPERSGSHFVCNVVLFVKTLQHFPRRSMVTIGKKTHDFLIIELFRDICPAILHLFVFRNANLEDFYIAAMMKITDIYTDFFDLLWPAPDMSWEKVNLHRLHEVLPISV